eukprot:1241975-Amphidinium_carterae.1
MCGGDVVPLRHVHRCYSITHYMISSHETVPSEVIHVVLRERNYIRQHHEQISKFPNSKQNQKFGSTRPSRFCSDNYAIRREVAMSEQQRSTSKTLTHSMARIADRDLVVELYGFPALNLASPSTSLIEWNVSEAKRVWYDEESPSSSGVVGSKAPQAFRVGGKLGNAVIRSTVPTVHRGWRLVAVNGIRCTAEKAADVLQHAAQHARYTATFHLGCELAEMHTSELQVVHLYIFL